MAATPTVSSRSAAGGAARGGTPARRRWAAGAVLAALTVLAGCVLGDPAPPKPGLQKGDGGRLHLYWPACHAPIQAIEADTHVADLSQQSVLWRSEGPFEPDAPVTIAPKDPAAPLPELFEVRVYFQGEDSHDTLVVDTAGLPADPPPAGSYWQQETNGKKYRARTVQEVRDSVCRPGK